MKTSGDFKISNENNGAALLLEVKNNYGKSK